MEEAKQELKDVVEFLRNPERFKRLGGKMPTGELSENILMAKVGTHILSTSFNWIQNLEKIRG